jgi:hypothetical protein
MLSLSHKGITLTITLQEKRSLKASPVFHHAHFPSDQRVLDDLINYAQLHLATAVYPLTQYR